MSAGLANLLLTVEATRKPHGYRLKLLATLATLAALIALGVLAR